MPVITELEKKKFDKLESENIRLYETLKKDKEKLSKSKEQKVFLIVFMILMFVGASLGYYFLVVQSKDKIALKKVQTQLKNSRLENARLSIAYTDLQASINEKNQEHNKVIPNWKNENLVYSLQIGGYKKFKMQFISNSFLNMLEYQKDGLVKYSLGLFSNYNDAYKFMRQLHIMGVDCFLVARYNGKKLSISKAKRLEKKL